MIEPRIIFVGNGAVLIAEMLHALEMVRDANRTDPHIPSIALACIEEAIAKATRGAP